MQNRWYGDKRDIVKWGTLFHLADEAPQARILQVLMMRQDNQRDFVLKERGSRRVKTHPISGKIFDHFRRVQNILPLDRRIAIYDGSFPEHNNGRCQERRAQYFADVCKWIGRFRGKRRVVLLDPDTGISQNPNWKHIGHDELRRLYCAIGVGDTLVLYQHRQRYRQEWLDETRKEFASAIGVRDTRVSTFQSELTRDVAVFAIRKSGR